MYLQLLVSLQYLLLCFPNTQAGPRSTSFPCGQAKCWPDKKEVCIEAIEEKDEQKVEQFCQPGRFWNECVELGCKHNRCRTFIITTYDDRKKTPIVTCEIPNKFPRERFFWPKPPYKLHPESHELWATLAMFISIIPFFVFGGFIGVMMCGLPFKTKKIKTKAAEDIEISSI